MTRVTPTGGPPQRDEQSDVYLEDEPSRVSWFKKRWWATALLILLVLGCIVAVVVGPVCAIYGCPPKSSSQGDEDGPLRLIVQFDLPDKDALDEIPAILHEYITRLKLNTSLLQILDFVDEAVLQEAKGYLLQATDLSFVARDFTLSSIPVDGSLGSDPDNLREGIIDLQPLEASGVLKESEDLSFLEPIINSTLGQTDEEMGDPGILGPTDEQDLSGARRRLLQVATVNDPFIVNRTQWHHTRIRSQAAWATTSGDSQIIIAVIDSGFDLAHPDLKSRLWVNKKEIAGNGVDDDGNGYVDDINGYDFVGACKPGTSNTATSTCICMGRPDPWPANTHGTHVAGLIAAQVNNAEGGAGSAPNVRLMLLRVADCTARQSIDASSVFKALDYAVRMGAHIVSMSLGSAYTYNFNPRDKPLASDTRYQNWLRSYTAAVKPLSDRNILVVAAAGNENIDLDNLIFQGYTYVPCAVPLPNVMCVGASDLHDNRAFFSNYGSWVHVSAPGTNILSTYWTANPSHGYGQMDGSSMATPIVSGVAALVTGVLGLQDGNFSRAVQVKKILIDSGDLMGSLQGASKSSRRINSFSAVKVAMQAFENNSFIPNLNPSFMQPPGTVRLVGFTETYWPNFNPLVLDPAGLQVIDQTVRGGGPLFNRFKYSTGVMVNMSAALLVNVSGIHTFTVQYPVTYVAARVQVNGIDLGVKNGVASFKALAPGYYRVSFTFIPSASPITITLRPPGAITAGVYAGSYITWTSQAFARPPTTNNYTNPQDTSALQWGFNTGFAVFLNMSDPVVYDGKTMNALYANITASSQWQHQVMLSDLQLSPTNFRSALLPPGVAANSVIGMATTILNPQGMDRITFTAICKGCAVELNGLRVLESWETFNTTMPLAKTSSCITLNTTQRYTLTVKFASSGMGALVLNWAPCSGGPPNMLNNPYRTSLSPAVIDMSQFPASQYFGWIGGVQCDVWRSAPGATGLPSTQPLYKIRLPNCASPERAFSACTTTSSAWSFTLDSLFPGLASSSPAGSLFAVRCWAYTNTSLPANSLVAAPAGLTRGVYLGGFPRYLAKPTSVSLYQPAPLKIRYGAQQHQLLVYWIGATATQSLSLLAANKPIPIARTSFRLPLWVTADPSTTLDPVDPLLGFAPLGSPGIWVQSYLPSSADLSSFVAAAVTSVSTPSVGFGNQNLGLNGAARFPTLANKVFYAVNEGWYFTLNNDADWSILTFDEAAGASTMVLCGDVVIRNAPVFRGASSPAANDVSVQLYFPAGYLRMKLISKIVNAAGTATYSWTVTTGGHSSFVLDASSWYRPVWSPASP